MITLSRQKTWADIKNLTAADLNTEFNGIVNWAAQLFVGTVTNDNAVAGNIGEAQRNYAAGVAAAISNNYGNITSINLTPGDWDVSGVVASEPIATVTRNIMALSAFSGNTTTDHTNADNVSDYQLPTGGSNGAGAIPAWRVSIASATTIYLKARLTYGSGSPLLDGRISARRVR